MTFIDLDRRFIEWRDGENSDPDAVSMFDPSEGLGWDDLLAKRRVVLLAEAGSGKTEELKAQADRQIAAGQFAFYATVQEVGRDGLERALRPKERERLSAWRRSGEPGWFLIDSVDEAKLDGVRLEKALRQIAETIRSAEGRAYVLLSGRYSDWEFRRDLLRLHKELPIPQDQVMPPPPTPDELVIRTIHHEGQEPAKPTEQALVVLMKPLDARRIGLFAQGKGAPDVEAFIDQIEAGSLWRFARRPLDLDWLVQFWTSNKRLGSLSEILETSLNERLKEPDPGRARRDTLERARAWDALERIGAALVLGRNTAIAIPDPEIALLAGRPPLDLVDVLPEWRTPDRISLLSRPVFDPATFGRVRLHNDNEGVVRSYLMARWLCRLGKANLPRRDLFDMLFADSYGVELIKPSMRETAAWLSLWDQDVAREVMRREPFLLMTAGDPASLSAQLRCALLERVVAQLNTERDKVPLLDLSCVKRFAKRDIGTTVRTFWSAHKAIEDIRDLALRLIWLGRLKECADIAVEAAFGQYADRHTRLCAGRALIATGDDVTKRRYAQYARDNCTSLPTAVVWDAVDGLFPRHLDVDDLLRILSDVDVTDRGGGLGFEWQGPGLMDRVESATELERLLRGLLQHLGGITGKLHHPLDDREEAYFPAIAAAAYRLLSRSPADEAPTIAIDAALRLGEHRRARSSIRKAARDLGEELHRTPARRRLAFWRAAALFSGNPNLQGRAIQTPWEMQVLGYSAGLKVNDLDWLLADAPTRAAEHERRLAINAALTACHSAGSSAKLLGRIEAVARPDAAMAGAYQAWISPPPKSAELIESERQLKRAQRRNAITQAKRDQSWIDFVAELRAHPDRLQKLHPTDSEGADSRLFHLWLLLRESLGGHVRYAIDSVEPLEPMLGADLARAVRDGLIAHWRAWEPRFKSARHPDKRNQINSLDCMGIAGVTLESKTRPDWAELLNPGEARRAAAYATLELNGFPSWLADLTRAKPAEVLSVLQAEVRTEISNAQPGMRCEMLDDLTRADEKTQELLAPALLADLERCNNLPPLPLSSLLDVVSRGLRGDRDRFMRLAIQRFNSLTDLEAASQYLGALAAVDAETAANVLLAKLGTVDQGAQTALAIRAFPKIFGHHFSLEQIRPNLTFPTLEKLVLAANASIRLEDDHRRANGEVFSHDARDEAESARSAAFKQLAETPGRATFDTLQRFADTPGFPIRAVRLRELARERAEQDSENDPWKPSDVLAMEREFASLPRSAIDLQLVLLRRLTDIQYDLLHGDFAQGWTLASLPDETSVQNWVADRLRLTQRGSYSVEREPHVVNEKEPDVRLRAKATDANVAMEIKVAESWSLDELEVALRDQLCGRYLRSKDGRHGVLLLVHQRARPHGWRDPQTGAMLTFNQVVAHLRALASGIATAGEPQPEIAVLDVSECAGEAEPVSLAERKIARSQPTRGKQARPGPQKKKSTTRRAQ